MITPQSIFYASLGGILPALVWLIFWLREDKKRPEPRGLILRTFLFGMLSVILVLPFQKLVYNFFPQIGITTFVLWAIIEEAFKFLAAYFGGLRTAADDEPVDQMIYLITAALGFVALENTLFILNPLIQNDVASGLLAGNLRFIGASLLHTVSSGTIGVALALAFYRSRKRYIIAGLEGFFLAVFFHTAFNLFIVNQQGLGTFQVFGTVWAGITLLLLFFEKVKTMKMVKRVVQ